MAGAAGWSSARVEARWDNNKAVPLAKGAALVDPTLTTAARSVIVRVSTSESWLPEGDSDTPALAKAAAAAEGVEPTGESCIADTSFVRASVSREVRSDTNASMASPRRAGALRNFLSRIATHAGRSAQRDDNDPSSLIAAFVGRPFWAVARRLDCGCAGLTPADLRRFVPFDTIANNG